MSADQPKRKPLHQLVQEEGRRLAEEATLQAERVAARKAEWDAKTPEEKAALLETLREQRSKPEPGIFKNLSGPKPVLRPIDQFTGMDEDEAEFLRDWIGLGESR